MESVSFRGHGRRNCSALRWPEGLGPAGRALPAHFEAWPTGLSLAVDERGALYPVTVDPTSQQQAIPPFSGDKVAISGDTMVIGTSGAGARAIVFRRHLDPAGTWSQQAYLQPNRPPEALSAGPDRFGWDVAVSGDIAEVGALGNIDGGWVHIFEPTGALWTQRAYFGVESKPRTEAVEPRCSSAPAYLDRGGEAGNSRSWGEALSPFPGILSSRLDSE